MASYDKYRQYATDDYWNNLYNSYNPEDSAYQEYYNNLKGDIDQAVKDFNAYEPLKKERDMLSDWLGGNSVGWAQDKEIKEKYGYDKDKIKARLNEISNQLSPIYQRAGITNDTGTGLTVIGQKLQGYNSQLNDYINQRKEADKQTAAAQKAVTDARESTITGREAEAKNNYTQARTQGLGKGLAASIGNAPLSGSTADSYQANYGALQNAQASTQNDYLNKLGYANALQNQADNMNTGSTWNTIGAFMQGMGGGAGVGSSIGGAFGKGDK